MSIKQIVVVGLAMMMMVACNQAQQSQSAQQAKEEVSEATSAVELPENLSLEKIVKSEEEWKAQLDEDAFFVLRKAGTERAFTGDLWDNKKEGVYVCGGCQLPLFASETKFKSGTGWPSFWEPIKPELVAEKSDKTYGMTRVEVLCARCDGHLGHVFDDGPRPTGLRYCMNSVSLDFIEKDKFKQSILDQK